MNKKKSIRILLITACILMIPLVAMLFTDEVNWAPIDFLVLTVLLLGTGFTYELIASKLKNSIQRIVLGIALAFILFVILADLAVGIFKIPGISGS